MKVFFVASEVNPIAKVGGLGDVIGALPRALAQIGVESVIVTGYYGTHDETRYPTQELARANIPWGEAEINYSWRWGRLPGTAIKVYFLAQSQLMGGGGVYDSRTAIAASQPEIERFLFLAKAAAHLPMVISEQPDLWHLHDWHAAAVTAFLPPGSAPTLLTIHNLANQGWANETTAARAGLAINIGRQLNIFKLGLEKASWVSTVSPTYAREIQSEPLGEGLSAVLSQRRVSLTGIVNGIDTDFFNPRTDRFLDIKLMGELSEFKRQNKIALRRQLGLHNDAGPLFGLVSRLTDQKGIELIPPALDSLLAQGKLQFVGLGVGESKLEGMLAELMRRYPQAVSVRFSFDEPLAHAIYAAADFFLMPSRFEPCGLGQLIAMRYGTVPIVRATGGLKDTVRDISFTAGNGLVFDDYNAVSLQKTVARALRLFDSYDKMKEVSLRLLARDWSWTKAAQEYLTLYRQLCAK